MRKTKILILFFSIVSLHKAIGNKGSVKDKKISRPGIYQGYSKAQYKKFTFKSYYVPMPDSILLAVDVFLPKGLKKGKKIPTIFYPTRYNRSIKAKFPLSLLKDPILVIVDETEIDYFTSHGYACVIADARGSGASQGSRKMEFSPEEILDGKNTVDWILKQPWCDGNIGISGISYGATVAEMMLVNHHPAIKACIPRSGIFDLYGNIMFPGGVCQGTFVDVWGATTKSLDNNNYLVFGNAAKFVKGIHPVYGDWGKKILNDAISVHKTNFDVIGGLKDMRFRDDIHPGIQSCAELFSNHTFHKEIESSGTAIYRIGGWYDGSLAKSCTDGFQNTSNTKKVLIGPWDHGPQNNASPYSTTKNVEFPIYIEMLRFFDHYLKGIDNGIDREPIFTYYTIGEETWKSSESWPLRNEKKERFFLAADRNLTTSHEDIIEGKINKKLDYTATTGNTSRWNSVTSIYKNGPTNYADRREEDEKLLCFTSKPLTESKLITGHPVVSLRFSADADDATVFCYLEDVGPDGSVVYITEGMLRPDFRKVSDNLVYKTGYPDHTYLQKDEIKYCKDEEVELIMDLLPISYQFKKGHSIRLAIAGADAGHFDLPNPRPDNFQFSLKKLQPSFIELPVAD